MNSALITGGLGLIGSFIAKKLVQTKVVDHVVLMDHYGRYVDSTRVDFMDYRKLRLAPLGDQATIERGEPRYFSVILDILQRYEPKYVFHLAALPLAKLQNLNVQEAQEGAVHSTGNILEACGLLSQSSGYKPKRFVYASSSTVYGDFEYEPVDETHKTDPIEIYGTMKLAGETLTRGLSKYYDVASAIIRPSAVYGPTDMNRRVSQIFVEKAICGERITIQGKDEALDFTYVEDIANGFVLAATNDNAVGETFNITHGKAHTLLEFVTLLKSHFPELDYEIVARDDFRPKRGTLSIDKAKKMIGYEPQYDLARGLEEYIKFVQVHNPNLGIG